MNAYITYKLKTHSNLAVYLIIILKSISNFKTFLSWKSHCRKSWRCGTLFLAVFGKIAYFRLLKGLRIQIINKHYDTFSPLLLSHKNHLFEGLNESRLHTWLKHDFPSISHFSSYNITYEIPPHITCKQETSSKSIFLKWNLIYLYINLI